MSALNLSNVSGKAVLASTFSRGAYDSTTPFVPPAGFEPLEVKLVNPQSPDFAASAYVNPKTGELVVAYRGSDSTTDLSTALQGAANGKWSGQFTDAAAFMKQSQGVAVEVVRVYSDAEGGGLSDRPNITTLTTGHSLGGAQAVAFTNCVNERSIPGLDEAGQVPIDSMVLFAPVFQTDGQLNTAWPTKVKSRRISANDALYKSAA
ncbi:MAG: hypothetical protein ACOVO0_07515 [Burkholderiaceae bacterium]